MGMLGDAPPCKKAAASVYTLGQVFKFGELWSVVLLLEYVHELDEDGEGTAEGVLGGRVGLDWAGGHRFSSHKVPQVLSSLLPKSIFLFALLFLVPAFAEYSY